MSKKPDLYAMLLGMLVQLLLFPARVLSYVVACDLVWGWYLRPSFGDGPGRGGWLAIVVIFMLLSYKHDREEDEELMNHPVATSLARAALELLAVWITVAMSSLTGTIFGWK